MYAETVAIFFLKDNNAESRESKSILPEHICDTKTRAADITIASML
jgi:hypothetical protein